jgi:hypothetical protein
LKRYLLLLKAPDGFLVVYASDAEEAHTIAYEALMRSKKGSPDSEVVKTFELEEEEPCAHCGKKATCVGSYCGQTVEPACDECCAHSRGTDGIEDGYCEPLL